MTKSSRSPGGVARTALVLAGGAARGAYEVGVVEHVLKHVAADLGRPVRFDVLCGTSVGALNACGLAAYADEPPAVVADRLVAIWSSLDIRELVRPDVRGVLGLGGRFLGRAPRAEEPSPGRPPAREGGFLDPTGLERLVEKAVPFARIGDHLAAGHLDALTVTATHVATGRTVVFVQQRDGADLARWSDPTTVAVPARIEACHALASAAVPLLFRAVSIDGAWYSDGGLRQNVPLSPARRLGASRVLVVNPRHLATTPLDEGDPIADDAFPGPLFLLGKTLNALLLDRIDTDLSRLSSINRILEAGTQAYGPSFVDDLNRALGHAPGQGLRPMRAMLVRSSDDIGRAAAAFVQRPSFARVGGLLGRVLRTLADEGARSESDLLSYVLFDGEFARELIEMGRADARARHAELCAFFA